MNRITSSVLIVFLTFSMFFWHPATGPAQVVNSPTLTVGSKSIQEGILLGKLMIGALHRKGFKVIDRTNMGQTEDLRKALKNSEIDLYPEYTGTAGLFFPKVDQLVWKDSKSGYETAKRLDEEKNGIIWLTPAAADNSWVIAVTRDLANQGITDLPKFATFIHDGGKVILASLTEFSRQLTITKNGFVYMFDAADTILIPPPDHIKTDIHLSKNRLTQNTIYDDIKAAAGSEISKLRVVSSNEDETEMIVYCNYFKPLRWYTAVFVPVNEINAPARTLVVRQSLIITILFMAGLAVVILLVIRIAKPLNLLSSYAKEIPELDFTKPLTSETPIDALPAKYKDEVGALAESFILMRRELSSNILNLINATASRERMESELSIAREIQLGMVPKTFPSFPQYTEFDLYATLMPAKEVGGDLYDFFLMDEDHLCFTLGDVSDKGVPSALLMVVTRTLIRTLSEKIHSPSQMMVSINNILSQDNPRAMFVTLIIGILNIRTGQIRYANGGHNPPIMIPGEGEAFFKKGKNEPLVGAMAGMTYTDLEFTLSPGEGFFLYTDGVNEAMDLDGEQYSNQRLLARIQKNKEAPPDEMIKLVLRSIKDHSQIAPQSDDIAMLMIKYNGKHT